MVFLENDTFLTELTRMFHKSRTSGTGSVALTMKKFDGKDKPTPKASNINKDKKKKDPVKKTHHHPSDNHSCLIRAKLHNKKISTTVSSKEVNRFQLAYCNLLKGNMDSLKKIKKAKTSKAQKS